MDRALAREAQRLRKGERDKDGGTERHKHRTPGREEWGDGERWGRRKVERKRKRENK